ncbi:MAG: oligoribonuclease [Betaproteobacteria bacterium TMED156]|nr:MAG: oligoribonuclease [Betaproteobacteria bacterium TMED156]|tara:strand:- start:16 stop:588 length:573 start_codon:yes stop_codon:yes gene_type:complete
MNIKQQLSCVSNIDENLIWVDMEMSGLDPQFCRILEVAVVVTDSSLITVSEGIVLAIHQNEDHLETMDDWNQTTHKRTGLIDRVKSSTINEEEAEKKIIEFLKPIASANKSPLCGNSVHQDRRFMRKYMPSFENFFHYRNLDVSTLKELCKRWKPELLKGFKKKGAHTALADIIESVEELKYYRDNFLNI